MDTTILRCPGCGANLIFNADAQNWVCESCGRVSTQKDIYNITKDSDLDNKTHSQDIDRQPELNLFRCQSCGAEMVTDENTTATFCVYCGNTGIMKSRLEGKYRRKRLEGQQVALERPTHPETTAARPRYTIRGPFNQGL